jgi:quercetin dioxygenase-like cupin family protein
MQRVFAPGSPFRVPDGTLLSPFLNPWDITSGLSPDMLASVSIAVGFLFPGQPSKIHIMPFVTQVTLVRQGWLRVQIRETGQAGPQEYICSSSGAVLTPAGAWHQLEALGTEPCEVFYIVTPAYVFEVGPDGRVMYDDSVVVDNDWDALARTGWENGPVRGRFPTLDERNASMQRIKAHFSQVAT